MSIPASVLQFIENFKKQHRNPLFAVSILRMIDSQTTSIIFDLLTTNLHINTIKILPNIRESLSILLRLNLIRREDDRIFLEQEFRESLISAFCNPDFSGELVKLNDQDPLYKDSLYKDSLSMISEEKLRNILEFIVSVTKSNEISTVKDILHYSNLIDVNQQITNKGFEFLLLSHKDQLWLLIVNSIRHYSRNKSDELRLFNILLEILMKRDSGPYSCGEYLPWFLFLNSLGIIFITERRDDSIVFHVYNTVLLGSSFQSNSLSKKFIILETNFKVYAYTSKPYEKSVLSLFSRTTCTFPNLIKAYFNEESLQTAFDKGITAKQIIKYLQEYSEGVPSNLENQINIWEQKQHRIRMREGYLYHDFIHLSDFNQVLKFLETRGTLIYKDERKRVIVGEEKTHEEVKEYIRQLNN